MRNATTQSITGFAEEQLQVAWCRVKPGSTLEDVEGRSITIHSPGTWNLEAGPDFLNAKLAVDGHPPQVGDVEIHKKSSDWVAHGHQNDIRYANVALHVVALDDSDAVSKEIRERLPDTPIIVMNPRSSRRSLPPAAKFPLGLCGKIFRSMSDESIRSFLVKAGFKRFEAKTEVVMREMSESGANAAFTRRLFEACGYKKNTAVFAELFDRTARYGKLSLPETEAVLWGESGLLPDPASTRLEPEMERFASDLWKIWWRLRMEPPPPLEWRRSGIRPLNFPERRVAALTTILSRFGESPLMFFAKLAISADSPSKLISSVVDSLTCSHPLWDERVNFTSKLAAPSSVLGKARASDICLNIVLPSLAAYAKLAESASNAGEAKSGENLREIVREAFMTMPPLQSNRTIETVSIRWLTPPSRKRSVMTSAASQQGAIHLHQTFCEPLSAECAICPIAGILNSQ